MPFRAALARARATSAASPSTPSTVATRQRERQAEISEPAEEVERAVRWPRVEQLDRARDHEPVQLAVDLNEIGRRKLDACGQAWQFIAQRHGRRRQRPDRVEPAGLQVERDAMLRLECAQALEINCCRLVEHAQHQRGGIVAHRDLDLRDAAADIEAADEPGELGQQSADRRREHFAGLKVRQQRAAALAEADQHLALLVDVLAAEPGPAAIGRTSGP